MLEAGQHCPVPQGLVGTLYCTQCMHNVYIAISHLSGADGGPVVGGVVAGIVLAVLIITVIVVLVIFLRKRKG